MTPGPLPVGLLLLLLLPAGTELNAVADRAVIQLTEPVRVTLTITTADRPRIEPVPTGKPERKGDPEPRAIRLSETSEAVWRIREEGPGSVEQLANGQWRWKQTFRLDPWPGGPMTFAPVRVNGDEVEFPPVMVKVEGTVPNLRPDAAHPVTGIEELPPPPLPPSQPTIWVVAAGAGTVIGAVLVLVIVRRIRRKPQPLPPGPWAEAELDTVERDGAAGQEATDRVAGVLRGFIERRFGIPAPRLTTGELVAAAGQADWPDEVLTPVRHLLERCDRAKFAAEVPGAAESRELIGRARNWVQAVGSLTVVAGH